MFGLLLAAALLTGASAARAQSLTPTVEAVIPPAKVISSPLEAVTSTVETIPLPVEVIASPVKAIVAPPVETVSSPVEPWASPVGKIVEDADVSGSVNVALPVPVAKVVDDVPIAGGGNLPGGVISPVVSLDEEVLDGPPVGGGGGLPVLEPSGEGKDTTLCSQASSVVAGLLCSGGQAGAKQGESVLKTLQATLGQTGTDAATANALGTAGKIADFSLNGPDGAFGGGAFLGMPTSAFRSATQSLSMFSMSGVSRTRHDGFSAKSAGGYDGKTPDYEAWDYVATLGARYDVSKAMGWQPSTLVVGAFGNYTQSDIDIGTNDALRAAGIGKAGKVEADTFSAGGYGLMTDGTLYGLVVVSGAWGNPETENSVLNARSDFNTAGLVVSGMAGAILKLSDTTKFDLRAGLNRLESEGDEHLDSAHTVYGKSVIEETSVSLSARLVGLLDTGGTGLYRPFVQGGVTHRFDYQNTVTINGDRFNFDDDDTIVFGRAGLDFNLADWAQAYVAVRGDASDDVEVIAGQVGITFLLN